MAAWDRSLLLPSPTTPSARFSQDAMAGASARIWVEEVIGQSLPGEGFAEAFKDGQALCRLVNTLCGLGTIGKVETSSSPFKQMANISAFIQACRKLGVRDHSLFETLVRIFCHICRSESIYLGPVFCWDAERAEYSPG